MVLKRSLKTLLTLRSTLCRDTSSPSLDAWSMKVCRPRISDQRRGECHQKEAERGNHTHLLRSTQALSTLRWILLVFPHKVASLQGKTSRSEQKNPRNIPNSGITQFFVFLNPQLGTGGALC